MIYGIDDDQSVRKSFQRLLPGLKLGVFATRRKFMKSLLLGILMIIAIPIPLRGQPVSAPAGTSHALSFVFSSNLHGQVEPCG